MIAKGELHNSLYWLIRETVVGDDVVASEKTNSTLTWHRCLGHMSEHGLKVLLDRNLVSSLKFTILDFCKDCLVEKFPEALHHSLKIKSRDVLDLTFLL